MPRTRPRTTDFTAGGIAPGPRRIETVENPARAVQPGYRQGKRPHDGSAQEAQPGDDVPGERAEGDLPCGEGASRKHRASIGKTDLGPGGGDPAPVLTRPALRPAYGMAVPLLGTAVPPTISLCQRITDDATLWIAKSLLARGILKESDWTGTMTGSLDKGLARWLNKEMGLSDLKQFTDLRFVYCSDIVGAFDDDAASPEDREEVANPWSHVYPGDTSKPIGSFGFCSDEWGSRPVPVKRMVTKVNKVFPDLGYQILGLLDRAFDFGVTAHGFSWAKEIMEMWEDGRDCGDDDEEDKDETTLTLAHFQKTVPKECCYRKLNTAYLARAVEQAPIVCPRQRGVIRVLNAALWVSNCLNEMLSKYYQENHVHLFSTGDQYSLVPAAPIFLCWTIKDDMHRVIDDFYEMCQHESGMTSYTWLVSFQQPITDPKTLGEIMARSYTHTKLDRLTNRTDDSTIDAAITQLMDTAALIKAVDRLVDLLDGREEEREKRKIEKAQMEHRRIRAQFLTERGDAEDLREMEQAGTPLINVL